MIYDVLEDVGLTKSETKVYLALLELGSSTTWNIIKKSKVASSKIYELLNKLTDKGLVTTYFESNKKYFKAVSPERLKDYVEEKKKELEIKEKKLMEILPKLKSQFSRGEKETEVELFKGYKGIDTAFKDILKNLKKGDEFLVFGGSENESGTKNEATQIFFERFHRQRSKQGICLRIIFSKYAKEKYRKLAKLGNTKARYLPFGTPSTINIYKDITILLIMNPSPAAIRIKDKKTTESFKKYFEQMWKIAKN